jgi:probable F420-dependent oxidoreductase
VKPLRFTVGPWGESFAEMVAASLQAEAAGVDTVWVPEMHRSATVAAAAIGAATSTVGIGTAIMLGFVRSPMTIALEALDLDDLCDGRFTLGLGSGVRRLNEDWHGVKWERPTLQLGEVVRNVRHFIAHAHEGVPMELEGERAPMRIRGYQIPWPPRRTEIPVYLAAVGPAMTRLAGRVADGWIAHELLSPAYLERQIMPNLVEGLRQAERSREDIDIVVSACCVPHDDDREARRWAAGLVAFYASVRSYEPFFEFHGFAEEARAVQAAFRAHDHDAMVAAVTDAMVDALTLAGTPDSIRRRLQDYDDLADAVKLTPPTHFVDAEVTRQVQQSIFAMVQEL